MNPVGGAEPGRGQRMSSHPLHEFVHSSLGPGGGFTENLAA